MIKKNKISYRRLKLENKLLRQTLGEMEFERDVAKNRLEEANTNIKQLEKGLMEEKFKQRYNATTHLMESVTRLNESFARVVGEIGNTPLVK